MGSNNGSRPVSMLIELPVFADMNMEELARRVNEVARVLVLVKDEDIGHLMTIKREEEGLIAIVRWVKGH